MPGSLSSRTSRSSHWRNSPLPLAPTRSPALRPPLFTSSLTGRRDRLVELCQQLEVVADNAVDAGRGEALRFLAVVHRPAVKTHALFLEETNTLFVEKTVLNANPPHAVIVAHKAHEFLPLKDAFD